MFATGPSATFVILLYYTPFLKLLNKGGGLIFKVFFYAWHLCVFLDSYLFLPQLN